MDGRVRYFSGAALALLGSVAMTACDPVPVLTVNSSADAVDVAPGDGVCETAAGNGVCTLRAAVYEGNALGAATIVLGGSSFYLSVDDASDLDEDLDITGDLRVVGDGIQFTYATAAGARVFDVAAGGSLALEKTYLGKAVRVAGTFTADRAFLGDPFGGPGLTVLAGATAFLGNSNVSGSGSGGVVNSGNATFAYSSIGAPGGSASTSVLRTEAGGSSHLLASTVTAFISFHGSVGSDPSVPACAGPGTVTSGGYNTTLNTACGFAQTGDTADGLGIDKVAVGTANCELTAVDIEGKPRGGDGDGNGVGGCDSGPIEKQSP